MFSRELSCHFRCKSQPLSSFICKGEDVFSCLTPDNIITTVLRTKTGSTYLNRYERRWKLVLSFWNNLTKHLAHFIHSRIETVNLTEIANFLAMTSSDLLSTRGVSITSATPKWTSARFLWRDQKNSSTRRYQGVRRRFTGISGDMRTQRKPFFEVWKTIRGPAFLFWWRECSEPCLHWGHYWELGSWAVWQGT